MANQIPFSGTSDAAGGYLLPPEQGEILTNGVLQEAGAVALCGDSRRVTSRRTQYPIWLGTPTAAFVGEGAEKPVTGGEFGQTDINIKKVASIVLFTEEMLEDLQNGDLNALVDSGVRDAINDVVDANIIGLDSGATISGAFDDELFNSTSEVEYDESKADGLQLAISAALGILERNGYGNPANIGVLTGFGFNQTLRDARTGADSTIALYDQGPGRDPFYGLARFNSTNLNSTSDSPANNKVVAIVAHRPNLHFRLRQDVTVATSREAMVNDGSSDRSLWQENLVGVRYETRMGFMAHDLNRSVVKIISEEVGS